MTQDSALAPASQGHHPGLATTTASSQLLRGPEGCSDPCLPPTTGMAPPQLTGTQLDGKLGIGQSLLQAQDGGCLFSCWITIIL